MARSIRKRNRSRTIAPTRRDGIVVGAGNYLDQPGSWLFTLDHKRIGVMYLVSILIAFFLGGLFALLLRTELLTPAGTLFTADAYNRFFTMHATMMVFLFLIPGIPAALGNLLVPLMLGAGNVAYPRLNLVGWWVWLAGALCVMASIALGGTDSGWTLYLAHGATTSPALISMVAGVFILGISSAFTGLNFIVTIHRMRPEGMTRLRMPLFLWYIQGAAVVQLLATPVIGVSLLLLIADRLFGLGIYDPRLGGDPLLFRRFSWVYTHPAVYIVILPAMGVISELIPVFSRRPIRGYRAIALSSVGITILSLLVWGHRMIGSRLPSADTISSVLAIAVGIPTAIVLFNWLATIRLGSIVLKTPMLYALSFLLLFAVGGLSGLLLASFSIGAQLRHTYFAVAHFHYVMFGGTVVAFLGGLHYWWPKMTGRMYSERLGALSCAIVFTGFNLAFFPWFVMGSRGMPRRYAEYPERFTDIQQISSAGAYLMAVGLLVMLLYLLHSLFRGRPAPANPWGGNSLEWSTSSPPPACNFAEPPIAEDPYDLSGWSYSPSIDGYVRGVVAQGSSN